MKFTRLTSLFALIALVTLSLAFTSAQVLTFNPSSVSQSISAGQSTTINFNLTYTGTVNPATIAWTRSSSNPLVTIMLPTVSSIIPNQSIALSSIISVPASASGTITATITVSGPSSSQASLPITFTITPPSSNLTISGPSTPVSPRQNTTLTVTNTGTSQLQITMSEATSPLFGVIFNPREFSLSGGVQRAVDVVLSSISNLKFGDNIVRVQATSGPQVATGQFTVRKTFCSAGEVAGNLTIESIDWELTGEGEDNNWELLDEIEIEVEVGNLNDDDDVDAIVELGLFNNNGKNVADELIFLEDSDSDNEEIEININDDDEETVKWVFRVPANMDKGSYKMAVKVYDDRSESRDCKDTANDLDNRFFQSIDIEEASDEGRFVVVDEIEIDSQVSCGATVAGQFTVFNIGDEDQDRVRIIIRNQELGVDLTREITSDLDQGDDETLDFSFQVPPTAKNGNYILEFITQYDYRNGVYRQESDDTFDAGFEVLGCSENLGNGGGSLTNIEIDAELDSDAKAGEELVVVATIKNTGTEDASYSISARGYSEWADLVDISDAVVSVGAGESEEVIFTLLVNEDSEGTQSFDIQVTQGSRVQIQEVEIELASRRGLFQFDTSNSLIWIIAAINLILIVLIIVVAVKLSRR